jgi:hypothetical protein
MLYHCSGLSYPKRGHNLFYKELESVFDKFPKCHMTVLLGDFNAKVGREDIFNQLMGMKVSTKLIIITELE